MKDDEIGRIYPEGELIFQEGEEGDRMYVVQSGKVKITKKTDAGNITVAILESGEIFGEMALFDRLPRSATALALSESRVLSIDKKKFFQTVSRDPTLVFTILESMSRRIRKLNEEFTKLKKNKYNVLTIFTDMEETCKFILSEARTIIPADNGSIMLVEDDGRTLSLKAAFGAEWEPKVRLSAGEGIAGDVLMTGKAELINNVAMDVRYKTGASAIRSLLCVPLKWKDRNFGVINMSKSSGEMFTLEDLKLLHAFAVHVSVTIENVRSFSQFRIVTDELIRHATLLSM